MRIRLGSGKPICEIRQLTKSDPESWAVFKAGNPKPLATQLTKSQAREYRSKIARTIAKRGGL